MKSQLEKALAFRALHQREGAFVIPNPWDIGSATILAHLGFEALATTSAGYAFSIGRRDTKVGRDKMLSHVAEIAAATYLPVSGDLENCYADDPEGAAETIRLAAEAGLVGCSIEDSTGRRDEPIYEFKLAAERVRAAAEAAKSLTFPFMLTARCENYLHCRTDLGAAIERLQAYQAAGADVLFAPGLASKDDIRAVVGSVDRPVNVIMGLPGVDLTLQDLSAIGVKRVSIGSGLARAAYTGLLRAAQEMRALGTFTFADESISYREISEMMNFEQ